MQYVDFGRTGLRVSRLGFGGIPVQRIDEPGTRAMLKAAHEAGINYIDTARAYTVSEEWIGQALEECQGCLEVEKDREYHQKARLLRYLLLRLPSSDDPTWENIL